MLTRAANRLHAYLCAADPWTNVVGLARTLLAGSLLLTLLANEPGLLFRPAAGIPDFPHCGGAAGRGLFCTLTTPATAHGVAIAILLVTASGWRPRVTALPHWYVAWSWFTSGTIVDGGDQLHAILALLLVPISLTDDRRWHWHARRRGRPRPILALAALLGLAAIRIQVAVVYFEAAVAKLRVEEWRNGTAAYYYLLDPTFGAPAWMRPLAERVLISPAGVIAVTWGTLLLESMLFAGLLAQHRWRRPLLLAGVAFHAGIAAVAGLASFSMVMIAACIVYLRPVDDLLELPAALSDGWARVQIGRAHV